MEVHAHNRCVGRLLYNHRGVSMKEYGIDFLRQCVLAFGSVNETFCQRFRPEELLAIGRAWMSAKWDIPPDAWTKRQVIEALRGIVPDWQDKNGKIVPVYKTAGAQHAGK